MKLVLVLVLIVLSLSVFSAPIVENSVSLSSGQAVITTTTPPTSSSSPSSNGRNRGSSGMITPGTPITRGKPITQKPVINNTVITPPQNIPTFKNKVTIPAIKINEASVEKVTKKINDFLVLGIILLIVFFLIIISSITKKKSKEDKLIQLLMNDGSEKDFERVFNK